MRKHPTLLLNVFMGFLYAGIAWCHRSGVYPRRNALYEGGLLLIGILGLVTAGLWLTRRS